MTYLLAQAAGIVAFWAALWQLGPRVIEERELETKFGERYRRYRAATRCWIPRVTPYREPAGGPPRFSPE